MSEKEQSEQEQVEWKCPRCQRQFMMLDGSARPEMCSECRTAASKSATFKPRLIISRPETSPQEGNSPSPASPAAAPPVVLTRTAFEPPKEKFKIPVWAYVLLPFFVVVPVVLDGRFLQWIFGANVENSRPESPSPMTAAELPKVREERRPDDRPWKPVIRFTGDADHNSKPFRTQSDNWRVRWSVTGPISIEVVSSSGTVEATVDQAVGQQLCAIKAPAGVYFLRVRPRTRPTRWAITVEE